VNWKVRGEKSRRKSGSPVVSLAAELGTRQTLDAFETYLALRKKLECILSDNTRRDTLCDNPECCSQLRPETSREQYCSVSTLFAKPNP
jgi:hypothetical protein